MAPGSRDSAVSVTWGHLFYWASVSVLSTHRAGIGTGDSGEEIDARQSKARAHVSSEADSRGLTRATSVQVGDLQRW